MQTTRPIGRVFRRLTIRVGSPAVIGALVGFLANHAMEIWHDRDAGDISLNNTRVSDDDKRIDDIRNKLNIPAENCEEVKRQARVFEEATEAIRTENGKQQLRLQRERLEDKKRLCIVYERIDTMPGKTTADIALKITLVQQSLEQFSSFFATNQLYQKLETLRAIMAAKTHEEEQNRLAARNTEVAAQEADSARKKQAEQAAVEASAAADRARREAEAFDRVLQRSLRNSR